MLTEMGYRPSEIVIAGDSAGGFGPTVQDNDATA
nr:hypothetical protein [Mycobacterium tuberculosis]